MLYSELKSAVLGDSHREDYAAYVVRFIQQAEGKILSQLDGYILTKTLLEADRVQVNEGTYNLPTGISVMRQVKYNRLPLSQVDDMTAYQYRTMADVLQYTMSDRTILFSGIPPLNAQISLEYYGMPAALVADGDSNTLINDYPSLYVEAAQIYVFKRARNIEMMDRMEATVDKTIRSINRRMRKKLGGAQSATPYNVNFRSSY